MLREKEQPLPQKAGKEGLKRSEIRQCAYLYVLSRGNKEFPLEIF